jgi:hypothetical protein
MTKASADERAAVRPSSGQCGYTVELSHIAQALVASGYTSLDQQAKVLRLSRSTTWTIVKGKHKIGRLSAKVRARILENHELPPLVRTTLQQYLADRSVSPGRRLRRTPLP